MQAARCKLQDWQSLCWRVIGDRQQRSHNKNHSSLWWPRMLRSKSSKQFIRLINKLYFDDNLRCLCCCKNLLPLNGSTKTNMFVLRTNKFEFIYYQVFQNPKKMKRKMRKNVNTTLNFFQHVVAKQLSKQKHQLPANCLMTTSKSAGINGRNIFHSDCSRSTKKKIIKKPKIFRVIKLSR